MPVGIGRTRDSSVLTCSANDPYVVTAITRSPGFTRRTSAPTACTTPLHSLPGENGSGGLTWYLFSMISTSGKLTLAALTAMTTSPGPGSGEGISSNTSDSGGPYSLQTTAFTSTLRCDLDARRLAGGLARVDGEALAGDIARVFAA